MPAVKPIGSDEPTKRGVPLARPFDDMLLLA
jgi:hypothetical protein